MAKYNKEAIAMYSVAQSNEATPGSVTIVDVLAALNFTLKDTITNQQLVYTGDETSRDEMNYYNDWYLEYNGDLVLPCRPTGTLATIADLYLSRHFNAAGAWVTLTGTSPNQVFTITNDPVKAALNPAGSIVVGGLTVGSQTVTGTGTSFAATDVGKNIVVVEASVTKLITITAWTSATVVTAYVNTALTTGTFANLAWALTQATQNTFLTTQVRFATPDLIGGSNLNKAFQAQGVRETFDLDLTAGEKAKLKMTGKGSITSGYPQDVAPFVPVFGQQKLLGSAAPLCQTATTIVCELSGTNVGYTAHAGDTGSVKNAAMFKLAATNVFGYAMDRFQTAIDAGFDRTASGQDFILTIREPETTVAGSETNTTPFNPYNHLGDDLKFTLKYGTGVGKYVTFQFDKLTLIDITRSVQGQTNALDLKMRNCGNSTIKLS